MTTTPDLMLNSNEPAALKSRKPKPRRVPRLHVRAPDGAEMIGVSLATWHRLDSQGAIPQGMKLAGCKVWSLRSLKLWSRWGCPNRREFVERLAQHDAARDSANSRTARLRLRGTQ